MALLKVRNLGITFGGLKALDDVRITVEQSQIVGLIGPNGAGKTTVFNLLTDVYSPTSGTITLDGENIVGQKTHLVTKSGIARTFQNIRLFKNMTVLENVMVGFDVHMKYSCLKGVLRLPAFWQEEEQYEQKARELLAVFGLENKADTIASNLPYGQQRKLEIVRALATSPKLLLLDEPAAGMNGTETQELMDTIRFVRDKFSIAILLIEHDMHLVMGICEKIIVLDYGSVIAKGTPEEIKNNERVIAAYLGKADSEN